MDTVADHAFATPYHSHVCVAHDLGDGEMDPTGSLAPCGFSVSPKAQQPLSEGGVGRLKPVSKFQAFLALLSRLDLCFG